LGVSYSWDERTRLARLTIRQTQPLGPHTSLFQVPLPVRFKSKAGVLDQVLTVRASSEDFCVAVPWTPEIVRLDPELTVLANIQFDPPTAMLQAQLADPGDMLGRLTAIERLAARGDRTAIPRFKEALNTDPFWGVRVAASRALRALHSDEALEALLASVRQPDARVRRQVIEDIGGFHTQKACAALLDLVQRESNPEIKAVAIRRLGSWRTAQVRDLLMSVLHSESHRSLLVEAALEALRTHDDSGLIAPLQQRLEQKPVGLPTAVFSRGLETLAWLARNEPNKDALREWLLSQLDQPNERIRLAALRALGTLGDIKAAPVLEKFVATSKANPEQAVAQKALHALHQRQAPPAELTALRNELTELQSQTRQLRQELDELKKKLQALSASAASATASAPKR
jgi:aminopeptidase N